MNTTFKYLKTVSTEMVIDTTKPIGSGYVGDVWQEEKYGSKFWHINDGVNYLYDFNTREEAVQELVALQETKKKTKK